MKDYTYANFLADFDKSMTTFCETMDAFQWEDKQKYAMWCAQTYYYVCHSTRLLALGAARCELDRNATHRRFVDHLQEEKGHEKLSLNDMKAVGFSIEQLPELPETQLFYQNQYYWLNYHGAMPLFGWILALEGGGVKACGHAYRRVLKAHGEKAGMFLKIHSEEDVDHLDKALDQIKDLPSAELKMIAKNLVQSCELYQGMLNNIMGFKHNRAKTAA